MNIVYLHGSDNLSADWWIHAILGGYFETELFIDLSHWCKEVSLLISATNFWAYAA